mmetsp:Transcript_55639/g.60253  ORF Transcript_55639/g.60253 Transcript_55639/m.60253 type:complete len:84 (-) Transcript_55639:187-438(-)
MKPTPTKVFECGCSEHSRLSVDVGSLVNDIRVHVPSSIFGNICVFQSLTLRRVSLLLLSLLLRVPSIDIRAERELKRVMNEVG